MSQALVSKRMFSHGVKTNVFTCTPQFCQSGVVSVFIFAQFHTKNETEDSRCCETLAIRVEPTHTTTITRNRIFITMNLIRETNSFTKVRSTKIVSEVRRLNFKKLNIRIVIV